MLRSVPRSGSIAIVALVAAVALTSVNFGKRRTKRRRKKAESSERYDDLVGAQS